MEQQTIYYNPQDEPDEELTIDLKKIFLAFWSRKKLIIKVFSAVLIFFILLTFIMPKKYKVESDLYINKSNNSNLAEINPFAIEELNVANLTLGMNNPLLNELELMQSPLVIDNVIKENDLRYKKLFGIIPTRKTGELLTTKVFLKKNISFKNKKGTKVVTIEYINKDPELAYNVVNSIINNYIILHKELNSEKSKSDKKVIEEEYIKAKTELEKKAASVSGLPEQAAAGAGNISAMSAFSTSAQKALSVIHSQVVEGQRSKMEVSEEAAKVANLSSKLQWAKMVEEMSDTSKVLVLKEPQMLRDFEYSSPKLLINILLGIIFGVITSLGAVIFVENVNKKLTYSMLGDNIIYDIEKDYRKLKYSLLARKDKKILFAMFDNISPNIYTQLKEFKNISMVKCDISNEFVNAVENADEIMSVARIGETDSELYKEVRAMLGEINKNITKEILV